VTDSPLIVSLLLDEQTQSRFEAERTRLFPAGRLQVGAHVTLFHALPGHLRDDVSHALREAAARVPLPVQVHDVYSLDRGVAYRLVSHELERLHLGWQARWREHLTRQDAQPLHAHVTVQNKVTGSLARRTLDDLRQAFTPWTAQGIAFELWRYDDGPWTRLERFDLTPAAAG
jgi:2'-5' RNA ligase